MAKMTFKDWGALRHFHLYERDQRGRFAYPLPYILEFDLMHKLDEMRNSVGSPFVIHESTGGVHTAEWHGLGIAVDGHFVGLSAVEQYLYAEQFNWPGLGFYPYWNDPGIHVDMRRVGLHEKGARWWGDTMGNYHSITPNLITGGKLW